ncbi:MAG TPA: HAD-IIIC family phosphatase [Dongiaceae bacterium]|nr:HAD-IIIC family phosphatase [Dongiaceae bacterium]
MSGDELYASLAWLPKPPRDFRERCRALRDASGGRDVARLAAYALDETQLRRVTEVVDALRNTGRSLAPLTPFKLGIIGNATLEPLAAGLTASAARHGIDLACFTAAYGQLVQEALAPDSALNRFGADAVLIALDHRGLPLATAPGDGAEASRAVAASLAFIGSLRDGIRAHGNAVCILQTLAPPPEALFGSFDAVAAGTLRSQTAAFNAALAASVAGTPDVILDVAGLAETVGLANWHSPTQWNLAKLAFDARLLPLYCDHVARIVSALRGKSRRCLIVDLDNTVWGGVIGDDGLEGIVIGQGDATGEAYLEVQRAALGLRERGIVLAVSSKNDDRIARTVFAEHPDMLLRGEHFAVFQANWNDKATNVAAIAAELSLGLDAMVFLDDNPVERGLVRELLPDVAVPELPDDPALYARTLLAAGYFEAVAFSDEDRKRARFYDDNARRVALQGQAGDVETYLASLDMRIVFRPFDATGRARIAQLINKSNQFNLTTRRYTEADVAALEADPEVFTLQVRLIDRFGDNGTIGVVVCRPSSAHAWEIDTWLMSCRVLGRRVEHMVLREILHHARARGVERLIGRYLPTARNGLVRDHYRTLGFAPAGSGAAGETTWELDTAVEIAPAPMAVDRAG